MIRRINGGRRRFGNRCFRFPVSTINPDFFNSSTGNEDEGNFFWEEISLKILIDCYFILFFIFFFFSLQSRREFPIIHSTELYFVTRSTIGSKRQVCINATKRVRTKPC